MDYRRAPWALLAPACLTLSSCQLSVPIRIEQLPDGRISIQTIDDEDDPACIESLDISDGREVGASVLWEVWLHPDAEKAGKCVSEIIYPTIPPGYDGEKPEIPFEKGRKYVVAAQGAGFYTVAEFVRR